MDSGYTVFRERREATIWQQMNRFLFLLLFLAGWCLMISMFVPPWRQLQRERASYDQLNAQVTEQKTELARLTKQITLLKSDRTYLETIARDTLELMKEGETIFRFEPRASHRNQKP